MKSPPSPELVERVRKRIDRGGELSAKGRLEDALEEYLDALRLLPSDLFAHLRAAEILVRLGRQAEAIDRYRALCGKFASEGALLRAIATCQLILQIEPSHAETLSTLSDLFAKHDSTKGPVAMPQAMRDAISGRSTSPPPPIDPATLARIPLFSDLPPDEFQSLAREFRRRVVQPGEVVVEEGAPGDALFAIAHGQLRVERHAPGQPARVIAEMSDGEFFGEMSLLSRCPRFATVVAATESELLEITRSQLEAIVAAHPAIGQVLARFHKERLLANVLRASPVLSQLPPEAQPQLADFLQLEAHGANDLLLGQAQPSAGFFILLRGACDVFHAGADGVESAYPPMTEGDVFGEISLLQGGLVTANVRTSVPSVVLRLPHESFDRLLLAHEPVRRALYDLATTRLDRTRRMLVQELFDKALV